MNTFDLLRDLAELTPELQCQNCGRSVEPIPDSWDIDADWVHRDPAQSVYCFSIRELEDMNITDMEDAWKAVPDLRTRAQAGLFVDWAPRARRILRGSKASVSGDPSPNLESYDVSQGLQRLLRFL